MERQEGRSHILIVDDDVYIGNMLEEMLTREGYGVLRAYSGSEAVLLLQSMGEPDADSPDHTEGTARRPDLILLDLMLPGLSGEELLPRIEGIPVIVVSAKTDVEGKVETLLGGASDYITKPFEGKELLARVAVQLRRRETGGGSRLPAEDTLRFSDIEMSLPARTVAVGGRQVKLTRTEYAVLKTLMRNPAQVVTKSLLLDRVCEDTPDCVESSLKVHMSNLRKKLREAAGREYIEAVWGIGFKMKE